MAHVTLWGSLKPLAGGEGELELDARNIRDLLARLTERHPGLQPALDRGISISIDGMIHNDALFHPLEPDSDVYILPRLEGG